MTFNFGNWQSYGKTPSNSTNKDLKPIKSGGTFSKQDYEPSLFDQVKGNIGKTDLSSKFDSVKDKIPSNNSNSTQIKGEGTIGSYVNPLFDKLTETDMADLEDFSKLKSEMMSGMFKKDETIKFTEKND